MTQQGQVLRVPFIITKRILTPCPAQETATTVDCPTTSASCGTAVSAIVAAAADDAAAAHSVLHVY